MLLICLNVHATAWPSLFIHPLICFKFPLLTCNRLLLSVLTVVLFLTNLSLLPFCHIGIPLVTLLSSSCESSTPFFLPHVHNIPAFEFL